MPYQRTRTDRASNCGQAWTKRLWSTSSRHPTKSWPSRGTCFLSTERTSSSRRALLLPLHPIIHSLMINICWIMSFLCSNVPFGPWEHVGWFFSTMTDVVLNWSQPCLNAQLCFSVYICFLRLCTRRWVCGYAVLQSICVVPVCFCCSEERVCVSGVSVCSWAQGRT